MDSHNVIIDIHNYVMDIHNYFSIMQVWISVFELWTSMMLELWISIISITDLWIALIEEWKSIKELSFLPSHGTVGLLSSDLVALMSWGPFHQMIFIPWWRHQMGTSSALLALCGGNSLVTGEFPSQRPVTWSFDVFFDLRLNKRLKQTIKTPVIWDAIALITTSL